MRPFLVGVALCALGCGNSGGSGSGGTDGGSSSSSSGGATGASVLEHHKRPTRDGLYTDPALTKAAAAKIHLDPAFTAKLEGPTYAQPLFLEGAIGGKDVVLVATEQNVVYALDAATGAQVWATPPLAKPVPLAKLKADPGCGNIDPLGITGTPYADLGARTIYLDAMTTPDDGTTKKHKVFALSVDDGSVRPGWPVDLEAALGGASPVPFASKAQNQRGALGLVDGVLYVPFGGHDGDCGTYHGWVVAVNVADPTKVTGWATPAKLGGIWAVNGVSSDGASVFATTGNTEGATQWGGGEAVIRLAKGAVFSNATADYFAPSNWQELDAKDLDLGGAAAMLVDVPGASPSQLVLAMGKDGNAYLLDRANLGGIGHPIATLPVATDEINAAPAAFTTPNGTFVTFRVNGKGTGASCPNGAGGNVATVKITPDLKIQPVWCSAARGLSSPIASTTGNGADPIVWVIGTTKLYAYDGETGAEIFGGGAPGDVMTTVQYFETPIVAKGRIYVAALNQVYAFSP